MGFPPGAAPPHPLVKAADLHAAAAAAAAARDPTDIKPPSLPEDRLVIDLLLFLYLYIQSVSSSVFFMK